MKKLDKRTIVLVAFFVIILMSSTFILSLNLPDFFKASNPRIFSHTKAICTDTNYCQDYHIFCENEKMTSMSPITGAAVQFSASWQDPRDEEIKNNLC